MQLARHNRDIMQISQHVSHSCLLQLFHTNLGFPVRDPPKIPKLILEGSVFNEAALAFHARFNQLLAKLLDITSGRDLARFLMVSLKQCSAFSIICRTKYISCPAEKADWVYNFRQSFFCTCCQWSEAASASWISFTWVRAFLAYS